MAIMIPTRPKLNIRVRPIIPPPPPPVAITWSPVAITWFSRDDGHGGPEDEDEGHHDVDLLGIHTGSMDVRMAVQCS